MSGSTPTEPANTGEPVSTGELRTWLDTPSAPRALDVRTPVELETAHIPGSCNVPRDTFRERRDEHLDEDVVLVCRSGMRAQQAKQVPFEARIPNVHECGGLGSLAVHQVKWLATAIGDGLVFAALTNSCAMGALVSKLPFNRGAAACDLDSVVAELTRPATGHGK